MIFTKFVTWVFDFVAGVIEALPSVRLPDEFVDLLDDVAYVFGSASYFLPIKEILICLGVIFLVDNFKFFISVFNWCISKIPTIK